MGSRGVLMTYQATLNSRERILLMGPAGTGKSWAAMDFAKQVLAGGNGNSVYVLDNDFSYERMLETSTVDNRENMYVKDLYADDWEAHITALKGFIESAERDDLLIIDSISPLWQAAQDYYSTEVFGSDLSEFFLETRKASGKGQAFDGWKDWGIINKVYGQLYRLMNRFPGHVIMTAEVTGLSDTEDKDARAMYGSHRLKPVGQKSLGHRVNTILLTGKDRAGNFSLSTVKDRGREDDRMDNEEYTSFFRSYIMVRAGWEKS